MNRLLILIVLLVFPFAGCNDEPIELLIPYSFVNQDLNLNLIQYQDLKNLGGYIYINEGPDSGYKGIIVYHEGSGVYRAFERACTYDPDCDPISVDDSGLFFIHNKCCNSSFNFNGNPIGGPASLNLLQYSTIIDGIYLKIRNN